MVYQEEEQKPSNPLAKGQGAMLNDEALVRGLQAGSSTAYAFLVERYHRLVLFTALRVLWDMAEAEELTTVILREIAADAAQYDPAKDILARWISEHAYRRSINHKNGRLLLESKLRKQGSREPATVATQQRPPTGKLWEGFETLSRGQRELLEMVLVEGLSFGDVARRTDQTASNVRKHFHRAVERLCRGDSTTSQGREKRPVLAAGRVRRANA